jgi:glycosyltransferase involved in cell wall biosynthesis
MKVYYFVHLTGTDAGLSGIPRVVRNLGRELVLRADVELVPVCWSVERRAIVHAEQKLLHNFSRYGGPELDESGQSHEPIAPEAGDWLLVAEAPHLHSYDRDYPPILIDEPIGYARRFGIKVAVVLHDILPLTFPAVSDRERAFVDLLSGASRTDSDELQRLSFTGYAHALALADIVLPVSRTVGDALSEWLVRHGHRSQLLPAITPLLLPEEIFGVRRGIPGPQETENAPMRLISVGTVCAHKNQFSAMTAFQSLAERCPELDIRLDVIGTVTPDLAVAASLMAKRSKGRIILHGHLPDAAVRAMTKRARASVFVSLAEGYGLPVAESLWLGRPCLCSSIGSMAEIARGGGCLTVNPRSLDEIEAGFQTLVTDSGRYSELLREIAARRMKIWKQYAWEIVEKLQSFASSRADLAPLSESSEETVPSLEPGQVVAEADEDRGDEDRGDAVFMISASDWIVHRAFDASAGRPRSLYHASALRYDRLRDGVVEEDELFFGPYVPLPAGRYEFTFDGEIDGELRLAFTASTGEMKIAEVALTSFGKSIPIDVLESVERFEIVGKRTPSLSRLMLRGAFGELRDYRRSVSEEKPADQAQEAPDSRSTCTLDDDGRALTLPFVVPASKMRVHDAFRDGDSNRLRAGSAIAFDGAAHGNVDQANLFYGPYLKLQPGDYSFRIDGDLVGPIQLQLTQRFAQETLLETVVSSFAEPIRLRIDKAAEQFEIIAKKLPGTRALTLRSIEIARSPASVERLGAPPARERKPAASARKGKAWGLGSFFRR